MLSVLWSVCGSPTWGEETCVASPQEQLSHTTLRRGQEPPATFPRDFPPRSRTLPQPHLPPLSLTAPHNRTPSRHSLYPPSNFPSFSRSPPSPGPGDHSRSAAAPRCSPRLPESARPGAFPLPRSAPRPGARLAERPAPRSPLAAVPASPAPRARRPPLRPAPLVFIPPVTRGRGDPGVGGEKKSTRAGDGKRAESGGPGAPLWPP